MAAWHTLINRLQSLLLVAVLLGISALAGGLLLGETGVWVAFGASLVALAFEPAGAARLVLALYQARPLSRREAPQLWAVLETLARHAGLPNVPAPYYVPSAVANAFAVGRPSAAAVALSDGLLRRLDGRELAGVVAHEIAHIAHGDLRVMGLADYVSRLTALFAATAQISLLMVLPWWWAGAVTIHWPALLLLMFSPQLALAAQLGLSRLREFDADLAAARLTGDPQGLASALAKIEAASRGWRAWLLPGWGNPEPSWLRTHPATEARIRRLRALLPASADSGEDASWTPPGAPPAAPRWRLGGVWR